MTLFMDAPSMGTLAIRACRQYKDKIAFVDEEGQWSYSQLEDDIYRCSSFLRELGVEKGDVLAQLANNRFASFVIQITCYCMGVQYMGLHATASVEVHEQILNGARCNRVIINANDFPEAAEALATAGFDVFTVDSDTRPWKNGAAHRVEVESNGDDGARMAFTGGTTGLPKPVVLPHRSLVTNTAVALAHLDWPEQPRMFLCTPISHGAGSYILPVLVQGGTVILANRLDAHQFIDDVVAGDINCTFLVPTLIRRLIDDAGNRMAEMRDKLQLLVYGAAPASVRDLDFILKECGQCLQQVYGQTEAPNMVTALSKEDHVIGSKLLHTIGRPTLFASVEIRDEQGNILTEPDTVGELYVGGPLVMDGYRNPETGELFGLESGWLPTGDLASIDEDGYVSIRGRSKEMIITGGFNVYPVQIERVLEKCEGVEEAVVVGVPDDYWGEKVTACIVGELTESRISDMKGAVRESLGLEWVPKSFMQVDKIPQTALGKADRKQLSLMFSQDDK
ncbi:AMP-binding protein [Corynebacterium riegelii]|uniref:AMP-binding protein n=1 Tax=Corynebacterium riegelii TaxID=156976 RepID=UPI00254C044C|nr:AMP-binding protein [Corynebacterium riegelii]MDK7181425.1 AMP-binding protein [Corynebacterium riegelii]